MPSSKQAAGRARKYVREALTDAGMPELADDAETIVSELAANAYQHVHDGVIAVEVAAYAPTAVISVWDSSLAPPQPRKPADDTEHGRGLAIVEALSIEWGWTPRPYGKAVYAVIRASAGNGG
jgi:anti-sigma regulatory factor (Ser/Thr protein kinase)